MRREEPYLLAAARELGISATWLEEETTLSFPSDPDIRFLSQLSESRPRYKRRRRPIRELPSRSTPTTAIVPECELPAGLVSTARLHIELELRSGITLSPATRSRMASANEITPDPYYRVAGAGRASHAWPLEETLAAVVARVGSTSISKRRVA